MLFEIKMTWKVRDLRVSFIQEFVNHFSVPLINVFLLHCGAARRGACHRCHAAAAAAAQITL